MLRRVIELKKMIRFFALVMLATCVLFGCKKEVKLNDYKLEDVMEEEAVFVYEYHNVYDTSFVWIFNKHGKGKRVEYKYFRKVKNGDEYTNEAYLRAADECMKDENIPFNEESIALDEDMVEYCIRYPELCLEPQNDVAVVDASDEYYYMICGTKKERHRVKVKQWGTWEAEPEDEVLREVCEQIEVYINDNW
nr:hypothetical protein [Eubacterium sp.]